MSEDVTILLAKEGNKDAFRRLYDGHRERVFRLAFRYTRSAEDAEDVMQETFIKAFRGLKTFAFVGDSSLSSWISKICIHSAIEHLRKTRRRPGENVISLSDLTQEPQSAAPAPDRSVVGVRTVAWLHDALHRLSPAQQVIFDLRYQQHLDIKEIAAKMGCSESNIKTQLARSVDKLRKQLEPVWGEP
ncbi:MAG: sigma-70 family RNA polymerase sigma factor [Candidatus Aminicenantes bacterium]|nr:sigma-70 family RNA polymerase sigma factor [Candidatus Aminicenantes bacterium]